MSAVSRIRIEFTVEPFVDNHPGPHVRAAWQAVEAHGCELLEGPFSSETFLDEEEASAVLGDVLRAALAAGATHLSFLVDRIESE